MNAAKSYILRPGNPSLETIRGLLQGSIIESNTSDEALGLYITKLRENVFPTEAELKSWPSAPNDAEKERLRALRRSFSASLGAEGQDFNSASVGKTFSRSLVIYKPSASSEVLDSIIDPCNKPRIVSKLGFPGRNMYDLAAFNRVLY